MAVVREDVVKLSFDFDSKEMSNANDMADELLKVVRELGGPDGTGKAEDGFDSARKAAKKFGDTDLSGLADSLESIADKAAKLVVSLGGKAIKGLAVGVTAGATAVAGLGTSAIKSYAEYEQLVGGVETLFGAGGQSLKEYAKSVGKSTEDAMGDYKSLINSQDTVLKNSNKAWKTAGLSANDYMSTVTSFSASLIQSLDGDTVAAAKLSNQAIIDMADNANKMGTSMTDIQNAYQGFAKQNYTMLDNLKLGYGGTQEEMKRLLKDAEKITGKKYDLKNFGDVVEAIHVIQEEMGIAGTTAKEASETIQGSALAMKAAWTNLLTGMANEDADLDQLMEDFTGSVRTFLDNLLPRIKLMAPRLIEGLTEITKQVGNELPGLIAELAPVLIGGGIDLLKSLVSALIESAPMLKEAGVEIIKAIYKGFTGKDMDSGMVAKVEETFDRIFVTIGKIAKGLADFGAKMMDAVGPALLWIGEVALSAFEWIGDNIDWLLPVLGSLLGALLAFKAVRRVSGIVSGFMGLFGKGNSKGAGGLLGEGGNGNGGFLSSFANLKPSTVLKGMGNLAIIIGGLTILGAAFAAAAPYIAELSDAKSIMEVLAIVAALGLVGTGLSELAGIVGKIPVATVAKGLANMAIIIGGLTALTVVIGFVAMLDFDYAAMLKLVGLIAVVGLVGSALSLLAGIVGMIPTQVVLLGLANIALVLGGFTAVIAAFAALNMIDGFNEFLQSGGEVLSTICNIIGQMAGSLIGGFGEGVTDSLPTIGQNLSDFATNIAPMFETFSSIDSTGLQDFALAFGALMLVLAGEELLSVITGGIDYAGLGTNLNDMMTNLGDFFTKIQEIPEDSFAKASALFDCLAGVSALPKEGGIFQWFTGDIDYSGLASGLATLSGEDVMGFFTKVQEIPEAAFTQAQALFECLAGVEGLPKEGGIFQWFTGDIAYDSLASGLATLASEDCMGALLKIGELPEAAFTNLTALFDALAGVTELPKEGGIFQWFTGEVDFSLLTTELPNLSSAIVDFYESTAAIEDFTKLTGLFDALQYIGKMTSAEGVDGWNVSVSNFTALAENLEEIADSMGYFIEEVAALDLTQLTTFTTFLGVLGSETMVTSTASINESLTGMEEAMTGFSETLTKFPVDTATAFTEAVTNVSTSMTDMNTAITEGTTTMSETLSTGLTNMSTAISESMTTMLGVLEDAKTSLFNSGVAVMDGLNRGMLSKKAALISTARSIANTIASTIDKALDINSPSGVTMESGYFTTMGQVVGMKKGIPEVKSAAYELANASVPYYGDYTPENSSTTYNSHESSVYTISPSFTVNISGAENDRDLKRKVTQFVREAIDETFESLEYKLAY